MICVFAGSSSGVQPHYAAAARELGRQLVAQGYGMVYGGASVGLMGIIADTVMGLGGNVVGVIPRSMVDREIAHRGLTELRVVDSMHQRKAEMSDLAQGFVALPGGLGTLEELFEVLTWAQLGIHRKPVALLNVGGYYDRLLEFLDQMVAQGFTREAHRNMLLVEEDPAVLVPALGRYRPPEVAKWLDRSER